MKQILRKGFTLVELLIVIALIAILSVAVLATINPVQQANKAKDSTRMNDAGEVLNAAERFYASNMANAQYPWVGFTDDTVLNDTAVAYDSTQNGFGLCLGGALDAVASNGECAYDGTAGTRGLLITTTELKDSFLTKGYSDADTSFDEKLYLVKQGVADGNSIYVCFIPKATANRTSTSALKRIDLTLGYDAYVFEDAAPEDFSENGNPDPDVIDFTTVETSLFKCVP